MVFKPGTVEQIRSVIRIAAEVPGKPVIVHVEGRTGRWSPFLGGPRRPAAGHLLEMRSQLNLTICVGGGIGTPERAAGIPHWQLVPLNYGYPAMPVDGILVGTAADKPAWRPPPRRR